MVQTEEPQCTKDSMQSGKSAVRKDLMIIRRRRSSWRQNFVSISENVL